MGKIYHPTPRDPTIQAVVDPDAVFDPDSRKMKMAFFNPDGSVASVGGGTKGDTGDPGPQGDPGASAYDVWLANGNSGTVDDYLASLKGAKGDPGTQGPSGNTELGSAKLTANPAAISSTSFIAISAFNTVVTTGARPAEVKMHVGQVINAGTSAVVMTFGIFRDGVEIGEAAYSLGANQQFFGPPVHIIARDSPAVGQHTYEVRAKVNASSVSILASATSPALLIVTEV